MKLRVNAREFEVSKLLGRGKGGYSYLAAVGSQQFVVKQIHHEPCGYYPATSSHPSCGTTSA